MAELSRRVFLTLGALATLAVSHRARTPTGGVYSDTYSNTY